MTKDPATKNKLRLIFVQPGYSSYRQPLLEKLKENYDVTIFFVKDPKSTFSGNHNMEPTERLSVSREKVFFNYLLLIGRYFDLLLLMMKNDYSVIVTSISISPQTLIALLISKIKRKKLVYWVEEWFLPKRRNLREWMKLFPIILAAKIVLGNANAIVVEGKPQFKYVRNFNVPKERIFFSNHSSLDFSKFDGVDLRDKLEFNNGSIILFVGRIIQVKGLDILIKAFHRLSQENPDASLVICGDGDFRSYCERLVKELGTNTVFFQGQVLDQAQLASYYKTADVVVVPSLISLYAEGWGLVVNEAMSMGKPIITTNATGAALDLVEDGINGYVVNHGNIDQLYLALKRILGNTQLIDFMGRNSRRKFEDFNDFHKMFEGFRNAINYVDPAKLRESSAN